MLHATVLYVCNASEDISEKDASFFLGKNLETECVLFGRYLMYLKMENGKKKRNRNP